MALIVGVDEVGRGCLAGPVYASAVVMEETQVIQGLKDSKLLTKKKREMLFKLIIENSFEYSVASLDNKKIDDINILNASLEAMENSIAMLKSNFIKADYEKIIDLAKEYIGAGDIIQVVPSQRFSTPISVEVFDVYRALRMINQSPYMYYLKLGDNLKIAGASPEMMVRVEDGIVETCPIAGTKPRGQTPKEDEALARELIEDPKEIAELVMLVDLGRNDLGRVCE